MAIITVLWEKWVEFRKDWLQITLSSIIAPLLYVITFGVGLGQSISMEGKAYIDFLIHSFHPSTDFGRNVPNIRSFP